MKTKYKDLTDTEIASLIIKSDIHAENEFCRRFRAPIIKQINYYLSSHKHQIEDIAQDTLLIGILNLRKGAYVAESCKLSTWMFAIVKYTCFNLEKKRKGEIIIFSSDYLNNDCRPIDTASRPDVLLIKKERNRFARNISKSLCPTKMQAVNSIVFDQKKIAEYAKSSNIDITVAKRRYFSGIELLKNKYSHLKAEFSVS